MGAISHMMFHLRSWKKNPNLHLDSLLMLQGRLNNCIGYILTRLGFNFGPHQDNLARFMPIVEHLAAVVSKLSLFVVVCRVSSQTRNTIGTCCMIIPVVV
ncbi:hypothetical protein Ddye_018431 [Dipteronia dyeriana]|uniref:Uncharacterized protein n=1 Tax=Dipteronia dyeriana TaxID=168575 RepID=A0AAD9X1W9_9ROSI|nr:hypothetical protein Ddye_018431 [Dipteronia dyeriana]